MTVEEIVGHDRNDINKFDRGATYNSSHSAKTASDVLLLSAYLVPLSLLALEGTRKDFGKIAILYSETVLITTGLTYFTKGIMLRSRPLVYNEDFSLAEKQKVSSRHSFFSGHTSLTAASFFFTAKVFSETPFSKQATDAPSPRIIIFCFFSRSRARHGNSLPELPSTAVS